MPKRPEPVRRPVVETASMVSLLITLLASLSAAASTLSIWPVAKTFAPQVIILVTSFAGPIFVGVTLLAISKRKRARSAIDPQLAILLADFTEALKMTMGGGESDSNVDSTSGVNADEVGVADNKELELPELALSVDLREAVHDVERSEG